MQRHNLRQLPANLNPVGTRCITLTIPDDDEWENQIYSQANDLARWMLWERDEGKNGTRVARLWRRALATWKHCPIPTEDGGSWCEDDEMGCCSQRFSNGKLQCFCGGVWQDVTGQQDSGGIPNQPGNGSPQPEPGGGTAEYCGKLLAGQHWLIPTLLNSGDVITISQLAGAWTDRAPFIWNCPNGYVFFVGNCVAADPGLPGDSLMSAHHGEILLNIGGTYYRVLNLDTQGNPQAFTIPPGVTNAVATLTGNFGFGSSFSGDVTFCMEVQNNTAAAWSHTLDFTISTWGFSGDPRRGDDGVWSAGNGWVPQAGHGGDDIIFTASAAFTATRAVVYGIDNTMGVASGIGAYLPVPTAILAVSPITSSPFSYDSGPVSVGPNAQLQVSLQDTSLSTLAITKLHIEGTGPDPFPGAPTP